MFCQSQNFCARSKDEFSFCILYLRISFGSSFLAEMFWIKNIWISIMFRIKMKWHSINPHTFFSQDHLISICRSVALAHKSTQKNCPSANISTNNSLVWQCWLLRCMEWYCWKAISKDEIFVALLCASAPEHQKESKWSWPWIFFQNHIMSRYFVVFFHTSL